MMETAAVWILKAMFFAAAAVVYLSPLKHRQPIAARGTVSLAGVTAACGLALIWAQKGGWWYPAAVLVKLAGNGRRCMWQSGRSSHLDLGG